MPGGKIFFHINRSEVLRNIRTMNKTKNELTEKVAANLATNAADKAKMSHGVMRWVWAGIATIAAAIAWFTQSAEQKQPEPQTPPQLEQKL